MKKYNILESKIDGSHNTLVKFTKGRDVINFMISNQRATYNKIGLGYEPKNNAKSFNHVFHENRTSKCNISNVTIVVEMIILLYPVLLEKIMRIKMFLLLLISIIKTMKIT